ncbi:hypothetical protein VPH35_084107 [Triticum aestivum]
MDPPRQQIQGSHASIGSFAEEKRSQVDASQTGKKLRYSGSHLPEVTMTMLVIHICYFLPLKDAARAACVSRAFRISWRCHPNLTFRDYNSRIDHILANHSGTGVKTFDLLFYGPYNANTSYCLDGWLQIAVAPGIEELSLTLFSDSDQLLDKAKYHFPCSLLSDGRGNSIRELKLVGCAFRPTIPSLLQRLSYLKVSQCSMLQMIESKAPNISSFHFFGDQQVQLFLGEPLQMKEIFISHSCALHYARAMLPSSTPNLETLDIFSTGEMVSTPMLLSKFLHLKTITISGWIFSTTYNLFSLVSFLDASPCLETFNLHTRMGSRNHDSIFEDPSHLGRIPGHCYDNLRHVKITRFFSTKLLVELTCHILENAPSLECLTLDITDGGLKCSDKRIRKCYESKATLVEAPKALEAIQTHIAGKVLSTTKLNILEPCSRCNAINI